MNITQKELARELGLSPSTVSRALANDPRISPETRARVVEAAGRLGYQPNLLAASIRTGVTKTIGLIVMDITNSFYGQLARGVEDCAYELGYSVILCDSDFSVERESLYLRLLQNKQVDGVLMTPISGEAGARQGLAERGIPYVLIDAYDAEDRASMVTVDHVKGAYLAIRHLIHHGHTRIGFVGGDLQIPPVRMMFQGYQKAMSEAGLRWEMSWIYQETLEMVGGYLATNRLLDLRPAPTAALFTSDLTAIAALQAVEERSLQVPGDFSIIGYDDIPMAARVTPALTTVAQDKYELGRISIRILIHEITAGRRPVHQRVLLQPELILRQSTAPVREPVRGAPSSLA